MRGRPPRRRRPQARGRPFRRNRPRRGCRRQPGCRAEPGRARRLERRGALANPPAYEPPVCPGTPPSGARSSSGAGAAGLFCALVLAEAGLAPVLIERGSDARPARGATCERFVATGELDVESNIQFGAGGAGTFSDGKLTTGTNSPANAWIARAFADAGASPDILWQAHPHIGSDALPRVVANLVARIERAGGEVRWRTRLTELVVEGGSLRGVRAETHGGGRGHRHARARVRPRRARVRPFGARRLRAAARPGGRPRAKGVLYGGAHRAPAGTRRPGALWARRGAPLPAARRLQAQPPPARRPRRVHVLHVSGRDRRRGGERGGRRGDQRDERVRPRRATTPTPPCSPTSTPRTFPAPTTTRSPASASSGRASGKHSSSEAGASPRRRSCSATSWRAGPLRGAARSSRPIRAV